MSDNSVFPNVLGILIGTEIYNVFGATKQICSLSLSFLPNKVGLRTIKSNDEFFSGGQRVLGSLFIYTQRSMH